MRCESCGAEIANDSSFCTSCGKKITFRTAEEARRANQPPVDYSQQYNYAPPQQQYYPQPAWDAPLSVGQYIGIFLLMMIPVANLILLLVWAFAGSVNRNKKNYARATLLIMVITTALFIILVSIFGFSFLNFLSKDISWLQNMSHC